MPLVWIAPYGTPTAGSGWVTEAGTGTMIRTYIATSATTATTIYPWQHVDFGTTSASATTTICGTLVSCFEDDLQWEPAGVRSPWTERRGSIVRDEVQSPAIITERDEAARRRRDEEMRLRLQEIDERHARAAEVRTRAHALLLEHLTPEQRRTFEANNWFVVDGKSGVKYRVNGRSYTGNVEVLNRDRVSHRLCGHCSSDIPFHDQLLAQKMMLEHAEDDFVRIANWQPA